MLVPFTEVTITPMAREPLDINAMAESPFIALFPLIRNNRKAASITTGIATYKFGRNYIGIEREKQYLDLSIKRYEEKKEAINE